MKMKRMFKSKKSLLVVSAIGVILVVCAVGTMYVVSIQSDAAKTKAAAQSAKSKLGELSEEKQIADTSAEGQISEEDAPQGTSDQIDAGQTATQPTKPTTATAPRPQATTPPASPMSALQIVAFNPHRYCASGTYRLGLGAASVYLTGKQGGTLNWQAEGRQNKNITIVKSGSISIPAGQLTYDFPTNDIFVQIVSADTAVRLRVTHPNEIVSAWYADPGVDGSCY